MRLATASNATSPSTQRESPYATPLRRKSSATVDKYFGNEDNVGLLVLDDPESYAIKQNASTIGTGEESPGTLQAKAAGNARWTSSGEAAVVVGLESAHDPQASVDIRTVKLKRKHLETFLSTSKSFGNISESALPKRESGERDDVTAVQQWLIEHKDKRPIAGACSKRTRFVGLHNNAEGGMWAILDRDIFMNDILHEYLGNDEWSSEARTSSIGFPHAVLEVRREGSHSSALIQTLDRSHLVSSPSCYFQGALLTIPG